MNAESSPNDSQDKSKWTRFGFGFESESSSNASTHQAQAFFLKLLPQLRENVTLTLFDSGYKHLVTFLDSHRDEVNSIKESIEPSPYPLDTAIRIFIHGWSAIERDEAAGALRAMLYGWATKWNLSDDWCLDHAIATLREQHISCLDRGLAHARFTAEGWESARILGPSSEAIFAQHEINEQLRKEGLADFAFQSDLVPFKVEGPFFKSLTEFRREVLLRFQVEGGRGIRGERKRLDYQIESYIEKFEAAAKRLKLNQTRVRWADEDHFVWLINYQCPPCKGYREIGRAIAKHEKTIREGVHGVAQRIGLTLRSPECEKRLGRPKGAKDKEPRLRVDRGRQKLRGNA
ncbi:MAG TPA: hypothetical protein VF397_01530 [Pyrinomonadaceae bacterium]